MLRVVGRRRRDWEANDGQAQSAQGFLSGAVTSRSFALVWGREDDDEPVLTWEHSSQCIVEGGFGLKAWLEGDMEFATLYAADEVWKFERKAVNAGVRDNRTESGLYLPNGFGDGGWTLRTDAEPNPMANPIGELPPGAGASRQGTMRKEVPPHRGDGRGLAH